MKKAYVKPELFYESFVLSQHIAACGIDMNYAGDGNCTGTLDGSFWPGLGGSTVFSGENVGCGMDISAIEAYCYTTGQNEAGRTFNS